MISYALNFEDVMLMRALKSVEAGFYIDVGANHPETYSVTKAFYDAGWRGVNVEPMPGPYALLAAARPRDINLACAVGAQNGEIEIWEPDVEGWATGRADIAAQLIAEGHAGVYHTAPLRTLADICAQWAPRDIHFLKIDVEGLEKDVLLGADFTRYRPWIVVVEATHPNSTRETHAEWEPLLTEADYRFVYADGLNRFYLAAEQQEPADAFRYPPNVFDSFKLNTQLQAEIAAAENKAAAHDAAAVARNAQESMRLAHEAAQAVDIRAQQAAHDAWQADIRAEQAEQGKLHALDVAKAAENRANEALQRAEQAVADRHAADADRRAADEDRRQAAAALDQALTREQQTQASLRQAEQAGRDLEAWARWAEERARQAEMNFAAAQHQIVAMRASTSWRVTGPLRAVGALRRDGAVGALRRDGAAKLKNAALRRLVGIVARPAVKSVIVGVARRLGVFHPLRAIYLQWVGQATAPIVHDEGAAAPPDGPARLSASPAQARNIHAKLQAALAAKRGN
jgi:FkbM family methyltransferase